MALTKRAIDGMVYRGTNGKRDVRWDDDLKGFGVRIYPNGRKAFVLSYRIAGRKRLMTVGTYGQYTIDEARRLARKAIVAAKDGIDPLLTRQRARAGETVKQLCETYLERHAKVNKRSWRDDEKRINRLILPAWKSRKAKSITREDIRKLHSKIGKTAPYEANRVLALISKMFVLAEEWGFVPEGYANPAKGIKPFRETPRDRWVSPQELPKLAQAIDEEPNVYVRSALWLYLLTGMRKSELLSAKWENIDWHREELRLGQTKSGRVHYVPLSPPAMAILRELPRLEGNPYLLPGHIQNRHLTNVNKQWRRIRKAAGVEDVRLHDLRRTVGSWLAQSGNSLHLIGKVLNHSKQSTTAIYARFGEDSVRKALEEHAARIMGVAGKRPAAEVVSIANKGKTG